METIPPHFRSKWSTLSVVNDPTNQSIAKIAGKASGVTDNPDGGGQTFQFANGALISYDRTSQPFFVYGGIYQHWNDMGGVNSGYGYPIADPQFLADGAICSIFVGGHVHQVGTNDAEMFPASYCTAQYKPTPPPPASSKYWPQSFRVKWTWLSVQRNPDGKQFGVALGPTSAPWPETWAGLTDNEDKKGGKELHFLNGRLVSRNRDSPPIFVYGKVYDLWNSLGGIKCGLGYPLVDPRFLPDGSVCSVFEGGHVHQIGMEDAEIVPMNKCIAMIDSGAAFADAQYWPLSFRIKWSSFAYARDPSGKQLGAVLGPMSAPWPEAWPGLTDNEDKKGGKQLHFLNGRLVSKTRDSAPILIYGKIYDLWNSLGEIKCGLGYPLVDPQFLPDGSICSIFEGGHVHQIGMEDAEIVPTNNCTSQSQLSGPGAAITDTQYWPIPFRSKWSSFAYTRDPAGKQLGITLGSMSAPWPDAWPGLTDNEDKKGGKALHFLNGRLVSRTRDSPPILVYGKIYDLWNSLGGLKCGLGYPLIDPQFLPDGSICSVFEGGHVHQVGMEDAEIVSPNKCVVQNQVTNSGAAFSDAQYWPSSFRIKWASFADARDPAGKQLGIALGSMSSPWPDAWPGLTDNEDKKGGKQLHFLNGRLVSRNRDSPPILVYGKIYEFWNSLSAVKSGLGYPLSDPRFLSDGSTCSVFEGGHVHQVGAEDAKFVPPNECPYGDQPIAAFDDALYWPASFRKKWASLSSKCDPAGKQLGVLLGSMSSPWPEAWPGLTDNEGGGKTLHFLDGRLVSYQNQTPPLLVYGKICQLWLQLGGTKSPLGYPLVDPQFLPDGSTCTVFESGHIHQSSGTEVADIFPAERCIAPAKPTSRAEAEALFLSSVYTYLSAAPASAPNPLGQNFNYQPPVVSQAVVQPPSAPFSPTPAAPAIQPALPPPPQYSQSSVPPPQPSGPFAQDHQPQVPGHYSYPATPQEHQVPQVAQPHPSVSQAPLPSVTSPPFPYPNIPSTSSTATSAATQSAATHGKLSARALLGKGMRKLGSGINRVADQVEKRSEHR